MACGRGVVRRGFGLPFQCPRLRAPVQKPQGGLVGVQEAEHAAHPAQRDGVIGGDVLLLARVGDLVVELHPSRPLVHEAVAGDLEAADRFGRRAIFTFALLCYTAASVVMACQASTAGILAWRLIAGIGIGMELVTIDTYIAELLPKEIRGRAFAVNQVVEFAASPVVALVAWVLVPLRPLGIDGWRCVVLIGSVSAIFVWFIRRAIPESPRWLLLHRHKEEALKVLSRIRPAHEITAEVNDILEHAVFQRFCCTRSFHRPASGSAFASFLKPREYPSSGSNGICAPGVHYENWEQVNHGGVA